MKKRMLVLSILLVIVLIGIVSSAYLMYYFITKCDNRTCFYNSLGKCKRTTFTDDQKETLTYYKIEGKTSDKCRVYVKLIQIKEGSAELAILENKDMICDIPFGSIDDPQKDLKNCHGNLKEAIQNIIIQRMQAQILENLGKISTETLKVI